MTIGARHLPVHVITGMQGLLGDGAHAEAPARRDCAIAGIAPDLVAHPSDASELRACIEVTAAGGGALVPLGLGAHRALGHAPARYDVALSTSRLTRVIDYTPADMTIAVESGLTVTALQELLAAEGQWLPVDPPLPAKTTVGGLIAAALTGPLSASQGRVRDYLIGVTFATADGRAAHAGGQVVKNVAGYDLMKLLTGSLGTLAVVTDAVFKVRPRPAATRCLVVACADLTRAVALGDRLAAANVAALAATVVVELGEGAGRPALVAVLGGVEADVATERERLLALLRELGARVALEADGDDPAARTVRAQLRDFVRTAPGTLVVRATTLPRRAAALTTALVAAFGAGAGRCLLDPRTGGVTLALTTTDAPAALERLRHLVGDHGGHLVVERWPHALAATIDVWWPLPPALGLMRRLKTKLDPNGVFSPQRFVGRI